MAAHQQSLRPDDEYLGISQQPIRNTLPKIAQIHLRLAEALFREACGLPRLAPLSQEQSHSGVLKTNTHDYLNHYAERLTATMPDPLNVCFFLNSASQRTRPSPCPCLYR
jgi:hypothetical protein